MSNKKIIVLLFMINILVLGGIIWFIYSQSTQPIEVTTKPQVAIKSNASQGTPLPSFIVQFDNQTQQSIKNSVLDITKTPADTFIAYNPITTDRDFRTFVIEHSQSRIRYIVTIAKKTQGNEVYVSCSPTQLLGLAAQCTNERDSE